MKLDSRILLKLIVILLSLIISGCGVKSLPSFPEGSSYPKQYPEGSKKSSSKINPEQQQGASQFDQYPNYPTQK